MRVPKWDFLRVPKWDPYPSRPQNREMICYSRISSYWQKILMTTFEDYSMDPGSRWVHVTMFHVNCCFSMILSYPRCFNLNMIRRQVSANLPDVFTISMINHRKSPGICGFFVIFVILQLWPYFVSHTSTMRFSNLLKDSNDKRIRFLALALPPFWVDFGTPGVILPSRS